MDSLKDLSVGELLLKLRQKDILLYLHNGSLRCKAKGQGLSLQIREVLRTRKSEISAFLTELRRSPCGPILAVSRDGPLLTSFSQRRLWFLDQLVSGSGSYNLPVGVRLEGELDVAVLQRSLGEIVCRHEVLRTTFQVADGEPLQVIARRLSVPVPMTDLSGMPKNQHQAKVRRLAAEEAQRPFDLAIGPLLRARLLRLAEREYVLLFTLHHIISDGWSMGVLVHEWAVLYEAFLQGRSSLLPDLPIQYADYAMWQRGWLQGEVLERQLAYWKGWLEGAPAVLELPTDRSRPVVQSHQGATYRIMVSRAIMEQLKALG